MDPDLEEFYAAITNARVTPTGITPIKVMSDRMNTIKRLYATQTEPLINWLDYGPFHLAVTCNSNSPAILDCLLELDTDMQETRCKVSVLSFAVRREYNLSNGVIDKLIKLSRPDIIDKYGKTLLSNAVSSNSTEMITKIFNLVPHLINIPDNYGNTPLHMAVQICDTDVVNLLLELGSSVNQKTHNGDMPIHYAVIRDKVENVKLLVQAGAFVNGVGREGDTPLHCAILWYSQSDRTDLIHTLVRFGADTFEVKNDAGCTPLMNACDEYCHKTQTSKTLLMLGADSTEYLQFCAKKGHKPVSWTEDESLETRFTVYFSWSLLDRLLFYLPEKWAHTM
jgi:ankyrin repeat protein